MKASGARYGVIAFAISLAVLSLLNDQRSYGFSSILDLSRSPKSPPQARHKC
jgi:hypothetical protein